MLVAPAPPGSQRCVATAWAEERGIGPALVVLSDLPPELKVPYSSFTISAPAVHSSRSHWGPLDWALIQLVYTVGSDSIFDDEQAQIFWRDNCVHKNDTARFTFFERCCFRLLHLAAFVPFRPLWVAQQLCEESKMRESPGSSAAAALMSNKFWDVYLQDSGYCCSWTVWNANLLLASCSWVTKKSFVC